MVGCDLAQPGGREAEPGRVVGMDLEEGFGQMRGEARALRRARHRVPVVARPPGVAPEGSRGAGRGGRRAVGQGQHLRLAGTDKEVSAGEETAAPAGGAQQHVGQPRGVGRGGDVADHDEVAVGDGVAHPVGIGHGDGGVGVDDPERLDLSVGHRPEHVDGLQAGRLSGSRDASQKSRTAARCAAFSRSRWQASMLASPPTSRPPIALGWPVT